MKKFRLKTHNLELVAATEQSVQDEIDNLHQLSRWLRARIPQAWPPQHIDEATMRFTLQKLQENPRHVGWWLWYFVLNEPRDERTLIGVGGFKGAAKNGEVEIGYTILEEFQNRELGSQAIGAPTDWAFENDVKSVIAETLPELMPSIRVLEKNGFAFVGEGSEEGVIRYRKTA